MGRGTIVNLVIKNSYPFSRSWKFVLFKKKNKCVYYFYNNTYYFIFGRFQNLIYSAQSNSISIPLRFTQDLQVNQYNLFRYQLFYTYMNKMLDIFNVIYRYKVLYAGKGYRLYVRRKFFIYPKLNYSHKLYIYNFNTSMIILSRWSMKFESKSFRSIQNFLKSLLLLRKYNIFTKKGIRLRKQRLYHKIGKVSTY